MNKVFTLCIVHDDSRILLGMKKRGFGMGKWNGFGGKVEPGENINEAAKREVFEEVGIEIPEPEHMGTIEFEFVGNPQILEVHVFHTKEFRGEPKESEEMRPEWFSKNKIPYEKMWKDDPLWFPLLFAGKKFEAKFLFGDGGATILEHTLTEV